MKKLFFLSIAFIFTTVNAFAKIWRVNNTVGASADAAQITVLFNGINTAADPEAANGDTIHVEPSASAYNQPTINKQVVMIGNGYLLSAATGNAGLQENTLTSQVQTPFFANGSAGTVLLGLEFVSFNINFATGYSGNVNITVEKCRIGQGIFLTLAAGSSYSNITFRKCFWGGLNTSPTATLSNITIENCIMSGNVFYLQPTNITNFIVRNNTFLQADIRFSNAYFANNIVLTGGVVNTFTACNVKNNIFTANQTGIATGPLSTNGNNLVNQTQASIIVNTGSDDGRFLLAAGSPAINGGVDIGGIKPSCGAFGGTDPYKLSGIPGIPTIYGLTVPASIPFGATTMNVTISTRNNN
jgi:hypothetical protein